MADLPDFAVLHLLGDLPRFAGFPHRIILQPAEASVTSEPVLAAFLVDAGCGLDVLNGTALASYLKQRVPILIQARRPRALRPFLRRQDSFRQRGYHVEVLS